ncbi:MAG: tetratricopeptide repeat protein [Gemmatimonadaceae bacterium]|nr:tetratricopeptide repeat protein [Gemmatimonadaceae bacterium]
MATSPRLDELKKKFDESPRRYFAPLANEYRKLGDLTHAVALCRAHLPNQSGHISGHIVLAQALFEARELGESRQIFEAALDLDPENLIALRYLGDIARAQDEPAMARTWYERVLDADPRNDEIAGLLKDLDGIAGASSLESGSTSAPPYRAAVASIDSSYATGQSDTHVGEPTPREPWERREERADAASAYDLPAVDQISASFSAATDIVEAPESQFEAADDAPFAAESDADASVAPPTSDSPGDVDFFAPAPLEAPLDSIDDPFASHTKSVRHAEEFGELEAVAEPSIDDWFSLSESAVTPESRESSATVMNESLVDEFFRDVDAVTPIASPTISPPDVSFRALPSDGQELGVASRRVESTLDSVAPSAQIPSDWAEAAMISSEAPTPPFVDAVPEASEPVAEVPTDSAPYAGTVVVSEFEKWFAAPLTPVAGAPEVPGDVGTNVLTVESATPTFFDAITAPATGVDWPLEAASFTTVSTPAVSLPYEDSLAPTNHEFVTPPSGASIGESGDESPRLDEESSNSLDMRIEGTQDFLVEYGEFVPPSSEDVPPFIATPDSVALEPPVVFATPAPEPNSHEPRPSVFVTETMAELYLQQGFQDEALSIYRQLLAQNPNDETLRGRVAELEHGFSTAEIGSSGTLVPADRSNQSVRAFFSHFALREPRPRADQARAHADAELFDPVPVEPLPDDSFAGAATRAEALTVPDSGSASATLSQLFSGARVSGADDAAAESLASAFGGAASGSTISGRSSEKELSLEHLFRDVSSRSSGAVTLDEFYAASSDPQSDAAVEQPAETEARDADIEQFTAWLEGLKKK